MTEPAGNYALTELRNRYRGQAIRVWAAALAVVGVWLLAILAAPVALSDGLTGLSSPVYGFFSYICHQIPERSLHIAGHQMAVCSRCFGVYLGLLTGIAVYPMWRSIDNIDPLPRIWLFLAMVPIAVDWSLTVFGIWENTHLSRFFTGFLLGGHV